MSRPIFLEVPAKYDGCRLSTFLRRAVGAGTALFHILKKDDSAVLLNGVPSFLNVYVYTGDAVSVLLPETFGECGREATVAPVDLGVGLLYEDADFAVMSKPAGMPVHPSRAHLYDTLANDFLFRCPSVVFRPLTRLDCDTSGLVLIAKNKLAARVNRERLIRIYYGVTDRPVAARRGVCRMPVEREREGSCRRIVRPDGKSAVTHWRVAARLDGLTLLRFRLETGRTHQIRVHCAAMGFPLCGDALYGGSAGGIARQALHAAFLTFENPLTGISKTVKSPLPADIRALLTEKAVRKNRADTEKRSPYGPGSVFSV